MEPSRRASDAMANQHNDVMDRVRAGSSRARRESESVSLAGQARPDFKPQRKTGGSVLLDLDIDEIISPEMRAAVKKTLAMNQMLADHAANMKKYYTRRKKQRALSAALKARGLDLSSCLTPGGSPLSPGTILDAGSSNLKRMLTSEVARVVADVQDMDEDDDLTNETSGANTPQRPSRSSSRQHVKFSKSMQRRHQETRRSLEGKPDNQLDRFLAEHLDAAAGGGSRSSTPDKGPSRSRERLPSAAHPTASGHVRLSQSRESHRADDELKGHASSQGRHIPHPEWCQHGPFGPRPGSRQHSVTINLPQPAENELPRAGILSSMDIMKLVGAESDEEPGPTSRLQLPAQAHARSFSTCPAPDPGSLIAKLSHQYWDGCLSRQHPSASAADEPRLHAQASANVPEPEHAPLGIKVLGCMATQAKGIEHVAPMPGTRSRSRLSPPRASTSHGRLPAHDHQVPALQAVPSLVLSQPRLPCMSSAVQHQPDSPSPDVRGSKDRSKRRSLYTGSPGGSAGPSPSAAQWQTATDSLNREHSRGPCVSPAAVRLVSTQLAADGPKGKLLPEPSQVQPQHSTQSVGQQNLPGQVNSEVVRSRRCSHSKHRMLKEDLLSFSVDMVNLSLAWLSGDRVPKPNSKQPLPVEARGRASAQSFRSHATTPCELVARQQWRIASFSSEPGDGRPRDAGCDSRLEGHRLHQDAPAVMHHRTSRDALCVVDQRQETTKSHKPEQMTASAQLSCCPSQQENCCALPAVASARGQHKNRLQPSPVPLPVMRSACN